MVTKLKEIRLYFENCDSITIDGKYIGDFLVDDLHTYFSRQACNCIGKSEVANTFAIEIHKDANKERYAFDQTQYEDYKEMTFDRIKEWDDITHIYFELEEQYVDEGETPCIEAYYYSIKWTGNNEYENESQSHYISKDGNLYIVIAKDKDIKDFFDLDEIDDSEAMDFKFEMYDCGDKYSDPNYDESDDDYLF